MQLLDGYELCSRCNIYKYSFEFYDNELKKKTKRCKNCLIELSRQFRENNKNYSKEHYSKNRDRYLEANKQYRENNKDKEKERKREYNHINADKIRQYGKDYREHNKDKINEYYRNKRTKNPEVRIRQNISRAVRYALKISGSSKKSKSILSHLNYSIGELKLHLEKQFAIEDNSWMNWNNYGEYRIDEWDDNDSSTWRWQIDHIKPQSDLPYASMEDDNFKKCWALENLRPYSAKQNLIEGSLRLRHKDK